MKVIGISKLEEYSVTHANLSGRLGAWLEEVEEADWKTPKDIEKKYPGAHFMEKDTVVFNIKRDTCKLAVKIAYNTGVVKIEKLESKQTQNGNFE